jgi:hypothetical protein
MAHTEPPGPSGSAGLSPPNQPAFDAATLRAAQDVADGTWQQSVKTVVLPHIELSLKRVRRARRIHGLLAHTGTATALLSWGGVALVSVSTAFAAQTTGSMNHIVPLLIVISPAWVFLRLQRLFSDWISSRERDLRDQELTYLAYASALAQGRSDLFRETIETMLGPSRQVAGHASSKP